MNDEIKNASKPLTAKPGYDVGYGKPPVASRFKKGRSGNPKGRPRGSKNKRPRMHEERMKDIILDEAYRGITVREGNRNVTIPMAQAVIRAMAVNAAKGQHRAQRLFAQLLASVESSRKMLHNEYFDKALTYKLEWDKELERRRQMGITHLPEPIPHPDHIRLNMNEGTVSVIGPMTKEEKAEVDYWRDRLPEIAENVDALRSELPHETDPEERDSIIEHIRIGDELTDKISTALSALDPPKRPRLRKD